MNDSALALARSLLFVPGNRPDRFQKALSSGADAVIIDLEDSVPPQEKEASREHLLRHLSSLSDQGCLIVRINSPQTEWGMRDIELISQFSGISGLMVPKCETSDDLKRVTEVAPDFPLLPIIESAAGYLALESIALTRSVCRLVVGHVDFLADTGMSVSEDQRELDSLRFQVAMCTRAGGLAPAVDGVTLAVNDDVRLRDDVQRSIRFGMGGKLCIHPRQIAIVHDAFEPSANDQKWAKRVVEASKISNGSALQLDGKMVDLPVVLMAKRLLSRVR